MENILAEMQRHGFDVPSLVLDANIHRFKHDPDDKKKSAWYVGFQNSTRSGELFHVVLYGSWKTGEAFQYQSNVSLTADDRKYISQNIRAAQAKEQKAKLEAQLETAKEAEALLAELRNQNPVETITAYMKEKHINSAHWALTTEHTIHVPMRDADDKLWGIQRIFDSGKKLYMEAQRVSGCFHAIGDLEVADTLYLCEGFATGCSIFQVEEVECVVVAFDAGNLVKVAESLKKKYPQKAFLICGDDDRNTKNQQGDPINPGRDAAEAAAKKVLGNYVLPVFAASEGSDFNDLHLTQGLQTVREQIVGTDKPKNFVVALGILERDYLFTSTSNPQIISIRGFSDVDFFNLMPREYWEAIYPGENGRVDWTQAKSDMMLQCRAKGIFNVSKVRGAGVWMDDGRVVVNQGDHLVVNGRRCAHYDIRSKYFYTLGFTLPEIPKRTATRADLKLLCDICETFKWAKKESAYLMAGLMVVSKVSGALPINPHGWATGSSQTGKSTLLNDLIYPTLKNYSKYFLGGTTEAGLRQSLKSDSLAVLFDEFETNSADSQSNLQACIELMRSAWSETEAQIAKGTSGGSAQLYRARFVAIVSSIRVSLINDADRSRFTIYELLPHNGNVEHWAKLKGFLSRYTQDVIDRIFARTLHMLPIIVENYELLRVVLGEKGMKSRSAQQNGMLLAGYASLKYDGVLTPDEVQEIAQLVSTEPDHHNVSDEIECLDHLLSTRVRLDLNGIVVEKSISEAIDLARHRTDVCKAIETFGVKLIDQHVYVATRHAELKNRVFRETRWIESWGETLRRLKDAAPGGQRRFAGRSLRCVEIPLSVIQAENS